jgi:hypothetical protein
MSKKSLIVGVCGLFLWQCAASYAQDVRAQYPPFLLNSYVGVHIGYIDYAFSNSQLESGFNAESVSIPHLSVKVLLFGHEFNKYLSAQISYLRPVEWVRYQNVNGDGSSHSVWMNVAGLTAKPRLPVTKALSVYGEGGLGIITRKGFNMNSTPVVTDANYATILFGGGLQYRVNDNWDLVVGTTIAPSHSSDRQPRTTVFTGGFNYTMRPLSAEQVERNSDSRIVFPKNLVQIGYVTDALGYGVNDLVSRGAVPIFWAADVRVGHGFSLNYQRNVFHTHRVFALDWGADLSSWRSKRNGDQFRTASLFPVFRFTVLRMRSQDLYFNYSLAGPTFISKTTIDASETGKRFTFQDFMGVGIFIGRSRNMNAEIRIAHYSNGNLFPRNPGVTVPLGFNVGYGF